MPFARPWHPHVGGAAPPNTPRARHRRRRRPHPRTHQAPLRRRHPRSRSSCAAAGWRCAGVESVVGRARRAGGGQPLPVPVRPFVFRNSLPADMTSPLPHRRSLCGTACDFFVEAPQGTGKPDPIEEEVPIRSCAYSGVIARTTSMRCGLGQIKLSHGSHSDSVLSGG